MRTVLCAISNRATSEIISNTYDGSGRVTSRVWKTGSTTNRTQTFVWDGRGRLLKTIERDSSQTGFDEIAVYDPLGRRVRLSNVPYTNGVAVSNSIVMLDSIYDPEVEFLELGVSKNGETTWKLYGLDLNGIYGGLNGLGGFEAIIPAAELFCPVVSDALGNLHGIYDQGHALFDWFSSRVTAFGAVPGYRPVPYAESTRLSLAHASSYRGKYADASGTIALGVRNLIWDAGTFLSPDPLGHNGNENLYTAFNGRLDLFDSDGRLATQAWRSISEGYRQVQQETDSRQLLWNLIYTGQGNPTEEAYDEAPTTAGNWVHEYSPARGGFAAIGTGGKFGSGTYMPGWVGALEGNWTIEGGFGVQLDVGVGLQMRGRSSLVGGGAPGAFTSQQFGWMSSIGYNQSQGFNPDTGIYGGGANRAGGAVFQINSADSAKFGFTYGNAGIGLILDPSRMGNLFNFSLPDPE